MEKWKKEVEAFYDRFDMMATKEVILLFVIKVLLLAYLVDQNWLILDHTTHKKLKRNFTVDGILSVWKQSTVKETWFEEETLIINSKIWDEIVGFSEKLTGISETGTMIIGELYQHCLQHSHKKNQGIFYTPRKLADYMAVLCVKEVDNQKVLDPACGSGALLSAVYDKMYRLSEEKDLEKRHRELLKKSLFGMDKDALAVLVTKLTLTLKFKDCVYPGGIKCGDFLIDRGIFKDESFDVVIGNPPYVGHKEIDSDYMRQLKTYYQNVYRDKGDLAYCFFERSYDLLKKDGYLLFLTSRYYFEAFHARGLRHYLKNKFKIKRLIDFNGLRIIENVGIDPALTLLQKGEASENKIRVQRFFVSHGKLQGTEIYLDDLQKERAQYYSDFTISQKILKDDLWRLYDAKTKRIIEKIEMRAPIALGTVAESFQGIITGSDKAFVFDAQKVDTYGFAQEHLHPWIKNKDVRAFSIYTPQKVILYTNGIDAIEDWPAEKGWLEPYHKKLSMRRECKTGRRAWYESQWGRNPRYFEMQKIVFPYKATTNRFALDDRGCYFSADIYGLLLKENLFGITSEKALVMLLNSQLYTWYFQSFAKKLGRDLYEYYPNTVLKLRIPEMDPEKISYYEEVYDKILTLMAEEHEDAVKMLLNAFDRQVFEDYGLETDEIAFVTNK